MKNIKFIPSKKLSRDNPLSGNDDINPNADNELETSNTYSKEEQQNYQKQNIQAGEDVVGKDVFTDDAPTVTVNKDGYQPETSQSAKQLIQDELGFDIDTEIELRQSIADEYQGNKLSIDKTNKPGATRTVIKSTVADVQPGYAFDRTMVEKKTQYEVTSEGIVDKKTTGVIGQDLELSQKAFKNAEELSALKIKRAETVAKINKKTYGVDYDKDVLTRTDVKNATFISKAEGTTVSESIERVVSNKAELDIARGDAFDAKADYIATEAYDYSFIDEGNPNRDLQNQIVDERFGAGTIEERAAATGTQKGVIKEPGRSPESVVDLHGSVGSTSANMSGAGDRGMGMKQHTLFTDSIVPIKTVEENFGKGNQTRIPYSYSDYQEQSKRILGPQAHKQHMKNLYNKSFGGASGTSIVPFNPDNVTVGDLEKQMSGSSGMRDLSVYKGPEYDELLRVHKKIEAAATEANIIKRDIASTMEGSPTKQNVIDYFKGTPKKVSIKLNKPLTTRSGARLEAGAIHTYTVDKTSSGAFRDVRSATIMGVDLNKLGINLPAISNTRAKEIANQPYSRYLDEDVRAMQGPQIQDNNKVSTNPSLKTADKTFSGTMRWEDTQREKAQRAKQGSRQKFIGDKSGTVPNEDARTYSGITDEQQRSMDYAKAEKERKAKAMREAMKKGGGGLAGARALRGITGIGKGSGGGSGAFSK